MTTPKDGRMLRPAELVQLTTVARRFHIDGRSKVDIATELGVSRFKVARLLERAHAEGLVRIEIGRPAQIDTDLSEALRARLGLRHAIVADTHEYDPAVLRREVATLAAGHLVEVAEQGDLVGIAWGRSLYELAARLTGMPACTVVQLCGVLSRTDIDVSSVDVTRRVAEASGGSALTFYAPLVVPDAAAAAALRRDHRVAAAMRQYERLGVAVVSVGGWARDQSTVYDALTERERRALRRQGAVAETCGLVLDAGGRPLDPGLRSRAIGIGAEQLKRVPSVVALAYGKSKADAVRALHAGGIGTSLVTHTSLAEQVLASES